MTSRLHLVISWQSREEGQCVIGVGKLGGWCAVYKEEACTISAVE